MFYCPNCKKEYKAFQYLCECGSILLVDYEKKKWMPKGDGLWRYQSMLPVQESISLFEGETPLIKRRDTDANIYMKLEGNNPTGSFKDRGSTVCISNAHNRRFKEATVASTGNMGASVAAYCAYANLKAHIYLPKQVTEEKISQILAYDAKLHKVNGSFLDAVEETKKLVENKHIYWAASGFNPYFIEGIKTIGFEIYEQLRVPDKIIIPVGSGGVLTAIYKSFKELKELRITKRMPQIIGVQPTGCHPITSAWKSGNEIKPVHKAKTIASAVAVKAPMNGETAIAAVDESDGEFVTISDPQMIKAIKTLGKEGVFAEPAAAMPLAALDKIDYSKDEDIVLIISGSGLKDATAIIRNKKK